MLQISTKWAPQFRHQHPHLAGIHNHHHHHCRTHYHHHDYHYWNLNFFSGLSVHPRQLLPPPSFKYRENHHQRKNNRSSTYCQHTIKSSSDHLMTACKTKIGGDGLNMIDEDTQGLLSPLILPHSCLEKRSKQNGKEKNSFMAS